jgi:hypothetical protein
VTTPSAAAVAAVEAGFLDEGEIRTPDSLGDYDPATNEHPTIPGQLFWSGPCQVSEAGRGRGQDLVRGGEPEFQHPYVVSVPRDVAPSPGMIFRATESADAALTGKPLVIRRVRYGTRSARRILLCDLLQATST